MHRKEDIQEVLHLELRDTALQSTIFHFQGNQEYHCTSIIQDTRGYPIQAQKKFIFHKMLYIQSITFHL